LTITTASPLVGTINVPFSVTLTAVAGTPPFIWTIMGNQPPGPGLTLNSTTGVISGTSTNVSSTTRTYLVIDSTQPTAQTAEKSLTITINAAPQASISLSGLATALPDVPLTITPFTLPTGTVNGAYPNVQLEATGGVPPYTWSVTPALPNGLSFNLLGPGIISGIPLNGSDHSTTHTFKVFDSTVPTARVSELTRNLTVHTSLTIDNGQLANPLLPAGTVGHPYRALLSASGGSGPGTYRWSIVGNQPPAPGLSPLRSDGAIDGTPMSPGSFERTYHVQDDHGAVADKSLTLTVNALLTIDTDDATLPLPPGIVGQPYRVLLSASGGSGPGTYSWNLATDSSALPDGLSLSPAGAVTGTPSAAGTSATTFKVVDAASTAVEKRLSIVIAAP